MPDNNLSSKSRMLFPFSNGKEFMNSVKLLRQLIKINRSPTASVIVDLRMPQSLNRIQVELNSRSLYITSIENEQTSFYFKDNVLPKNHKNQKSFNFTENYSDVWSKDISNEERGKTAKDSLKNVGPDLICSSIMSLQDWNQNESKKAKLNASGNKIANVSKDAVLPLCWFLSESARFYPVAETFSKAFDGIYTEESLNMYDIGNTTSRWRALTEASAFATVAVPHMPSIKEPHKIEPTAGK